MAVGLTKPLDSSVTIMSRASCSFASFTLPFRIRVAWCTDESLAHAAAPPTKTELRLRDFANSNTEPFRVESLVIIPVSIVDVH
eukprot:7743100-Pyramimonas_sp.AAC.1